MENSSLMSESEVQINFKMFKYGCIALLVLMFRFSGFDVSYGSVSLLSLANQLMQLGIGLWMGGLVFKIGTSLNWKAWQKCLGAIACLFQPTAFLMFFLFRNKLRKKDFQTAIQ